MHTTMHTLKRAASVHGSIREPRTRDLQQDHTCPTHLQHVIESRTSMSVAAYEFAKESKKVCLVGVY